MKWTRIFTGAFFVAFGLSMIYGQTFTGQGYIIGALSLGAGICGVLGK